MRISAICIIMIYSTIMYCSENIKHLLIALISVYEDAINHYNGNNLGKGKPGKENRVGTPKCPPKDLSYVTLVTIL